MINESLIKKSSLVIFLIILFAPTLSLSSSTCEYDLQIDLTKDENIHFIDKISTKDESVGNEELFWVYYPSTEEYRQVTARLLAVGQYCYIYVDLVTIASMGEPNAISKSLALATEFDSTMWPTDLALMGHPDGTSGDVDGDPRFTALLTPFEFGGVYYYKDEDPSHPYSNHREMAYMHPAKNFYHSCYTLIHEFNHLIWFNNERDEAIFMLEGVAEYSSYKAGYLNNVSFIYQGVAGGYNLTINSIDFINHPERSLLYWDYDNPVLNRASYGRSYLFVLYLAERFGEEIITDLVTISEDGPSGIEVALDNQGYNLTFNEVYLDWITASTIDRVGFSNGKFGYKTADFTINRVTEITELPYSSVTTRHHLYGFNAIKINSPPDEFTLKIDNPKPHSLGVSIVIHDETGWHVNKTIITSEADELYIYGLGSNIELAYVITSMITDGTPTASNFYYPRITADYLDLYYSILNGHIDTNSELNGYQVFIIVIPVLIGFWILRKRKKW